MSDRRTFLKQAGLMMALGSPASRPASAAVAASLSGESSESDHRGWKPTWIKQADGKNGWVLRPAQIQFLHHGDGKLPYFDAKFMQFMPFGVQQMDNREIALIGAVNDESKKWPRSQLPAIAFSQDLGNRWTPIKRIDETETCYGRPMLFTDLGGGNLMFQTEAEPAMQYFSHDYGRTWTDRQPLQPASNGEAFNVEGSALVDRDASGRAKRIAVAGYNYPKGRQFPKDPAVAMLRWSEDQGRTWVRETQPDWNWAEKYEGQSYRHGTGEGSLVRAKNGWIVAALRADMPAKFYPYHNDNLMGIGVSVSKDEGKTWTALQMLHHAGRMHTHLIVLPGGQIVLTYIMRQDVEAGRLASYRRGAGAVLSSDNGLTWDMDHRYLLGDFEFADGTPFALACGHQWSALLHDGSVLTVFGHYASKGACLVKWKPRV